MKIKLLGILILSILLLGCPFAPNADESNFGVLVINYPEWCFGEVYGDTVDYFNDYWNYYCYGYSDWKDWNSSEGKLVCSLIDESLLPGNFDGKYRLFVINQFLYICFNDRKMTYIQLHNYYGDYERKNTNRISVKQSSEDVFEYHATLKGESAKQFYGKQTHVKLEKVSGNQFKYNLEIDGKNYVSETMTNYKAEYGSAVFPKKLEEYGWLPKKGMCFGFYLNRPCSVSNRTSFEEFENLLSIDRTIGEWVDEQLMFCFDGISLRAIDEESQTVSYNFLDAKKNGHCDYFEIKIDSFDEKAEESKKYKGALTFYKIENGVPRVLYRYTTQWIDENTEFNENSVDFW